MSYSNLTICAHCGHHHELITAVEKKGKTVAKYEPRPRDGDATLCFGCGRWNIVDDGSDGGLRKPTDEESEQLSADLTSRTIADAWQAFRKTFKY
jgi:hypothetical protein